MTSGAHDDGAAGRGLPQARQAGLDPGRRDGRLLDRGQHRPAVRRPAGDLRLEVHQPALRAGRPHRRPGRPHGAVADGLRLAPPGPRLPAVRVALRHGHLLRRGAPAPPRDRLLRARRRDRLRRRADRGRPVASRSPTPSSSRPRTSHGTEAREVPAKRVQEAHTSAELMEKITGTAVDSPALLHLRHEDAACWVLLRLRGLREHQRLQLSPRRERARHLRDGPVLRCLNMPVIRCHASVNVSSGKRAVSMVSACRTQRRRRTAPSRNR